MTRANQTTGLTNGIPQIEHRKSCLVLSARFPVVNWRSRPVGKSACLLPRRALWHGTKVWHRIYPIWNAPLSRSTQRNFASSQKSPRYNRSNVCEQKLFPVWFSWRRVNILTLKKVRLILINLLNVAASFHVCENTVTKQNLQPNK